MDRNMVMEVASLLAMPDIFTEQAYWIRWIEPLRLSRSSVTLIV